MRPSLFEFAGGHQAFLDLATAHHARCLQGPELNHPFSKRDQHPQHVERLPAYWAEVLGGPPVYSTECGTHADVVHLHAGDEDLSDLNRRFLAWLVQALDDAGLPDDPAFRAAMRDYLTWSLTEVTGRPGAGADVPDGTAIPRWSWDGLQT